jgi:[ribosomal protein S18]-alanine N-acetyltransferase
MSSSEPRTTVKTSCRGVTLREFLPKDFKSICKLDEECFPPEIAYDPEEIAGALAQPHTFCIVAEREEQVIGFILVHYRRAVGHIITIDIRPDFRRGGIGNRLMDTAEKRFQQLGVRRVVLEVDLRNESAIAFYAARGYATRRILYHYYRDGSDAWLMEKPL